MAAVAEDFFPVEHQNLEVRVLARDLTTSVLIKGPWEHLPHCAEIVLSAAVGNFQDLDESVPEVYHDVLPKPKLSTKDAQGFDALQLVGHQTGCDLTLVGSQLQERFLASEIEDVHEFLQDLKAPTGPSSTGAARRGRAEKQDETANGARPSGPPVRPNAPVQPAHAAPVPAARREQTKRIVEIAGLSRKDLLTCNGLVIRKLQDLHAVHVKILDPKDIPNLPEDGTSRDEGSTQPPGPRSGWSTQRWVGRAVLGFGHSIPPRRSFFFVFVLSQNDFSALGFVLDELRLARTDAEALAGKEKGRKDTRFLVPLMRSWQEALQVDVTLSAEKGPSVVQIRLCGEPDQLAALKSAVGSLLVLSERLAKLLNGSLAKNTKLLKDIFMEVLEQRLPRPVQEEDASLTGDKGEAAQLRKICRRWGQEALELLGRSFVLKTLGFVGRRFEGLVQEPWQCRAESVSEVGGDEVFAIECDELERVVRDGTVAVPLSESKELDLKVKVGQCVSFRLTLLEDLPTAADLELAAWRPPMTRPPAPHAPDRAPVIEMRVDEMGRRYFWNHSDATSSWMPGRRRSNWTLLDTLRSGETVTVVRQAPQLAASCAAFAVWYAGSGVVTWGDSRRGGDSSGVRHQLKNVQDIQASEGAFAAVLADGSVVTWGDARHGGDSSGVQDQLKNVQRIQASKVAFAAILADGSVVAWGDGAGGGDCSRVQHQLKAVQSIRASHRAFAALLADGSVVSWGDPSYGGDSSSVQHQLTNVQRIQANRLAFVAWLADGSIATWGNSSSGGDGRLSEDQLKNAQHIEASEYGFAALLADGSVVGWGHLVSRIDRYTQSQLKNQVRKIHSSYRAFAALLADGSVVTWGDPYAGGDCSAVEDQLKNVQQIQAAEAAFAAILPDRSVVTWGGARYGGDSSKVQHQLKDVQQIQASETAFAAICGNGSLVTWGDDASGGDSSNRCSGQANAHFFGPCADSPHFFGPARRSLEQSHGQRGRPLRMTGSDRRRCQVRPTPSPSTLAPPEASPPATPASPQESPDEGRTALDSMIDEQTALDKIIQEAQQREDEDPYGEWDDRDREGPPGQGDEEEARRKRKHRVSGEHR
eukprot:g6923.t1